MNEKLVLTCAHGAPWYGCGPQRPVGHYHCVGCAKEGLRLIREFWQGVSEGRWDEQGYTPSERRAQAKRQ